MDGIHNLRFSVSKGISIWTVLPPKGTKRNGISLNQRSSQHWGWSVRIELMLLWIFECITLLNIINSSLSVKENRWCLYSLLSDMKAIFILQIYRLIMPEHTWIRNRMLLVSQYFTEISSNNDNKSISSIAHTKSNFSVRCSSIRVQVISAGEIVEITSLRINYKLIILKNISYTKSGL